MSDSMEDRIKALEDALRDAQNALDKSEAKVALLMGERNAALAALPDAQTIIAGAYEAAAKAGCEALEGLMGDDMALFVAERIVPAIISATPAAAIAARDAMIAEAVAKEREACLAEIQTSIFYPEDRSSYSPSEDLRAKVEGAAARAAGSYCSQYVKTTEREAMAFSILQMESIIRGAKQRLDTIAAAIRKRGEDQP